MGLKKFEISFKPFITVGFVLLIAKLLGLFNYSWWLVFLPFYIVHLVGSILLVIIKIIIWGLDLLIYIERKWKKKK